MDYHGSTATFGPGGRGQLADVTVRNSRDTQVAISSTQETSASKHMKTLNKHWDRKGLSESR